MRERKGGKVRDQQNVEQMLQKRSSESGDQQLQCGGKPVLWEGIIENHHGTKRESGDTA